MSHKLSSHILHITNKISCRTPIARAARASTLTMVLSAIAPSRSRCGADLAPILFSEAASNEETS